MEFEQSANHSAEEVNEAVEESPVQQEEVTEEVPATTQEDFFEVKYNKENMRISRDEAPSYIQKGLNYDKVQQKASWYEQLLHDITAETGYESIEQLGSYLQESRQQREIQKRAQEIGIPEEAYQQHFEPVNTELSQLKQELETLRAAEIQRTVERELESLKSKYPDFSEYEEKVFTVATEKGYSLEDAYKLATYDDRLAKIAREKEQEVLARVTGRDERQVLASNDQPGNVDFDPSTMSLDDIQKLSERARRGERIVL